MKKINQILITIILLFISINVRAQAPVLIKGVVYEYDNEKKLIPLPYANIFWLENHKGVSTDEKGSFVLEKTSKLSHLIVSFIGYKSDTILISDVKKDIKIILSNNSELSGVVINGGMEGAYISRLNPIKTEVITQAGLNKLACCNLSESFQNSATVDVGYSDAVSGAKQIQMLGLAGIYSQMMWENMPFLRGLSSSYGLSYVPGSWMESIQISKGTSSVINGYESVTGQINVEYKKPQTAKPLFINYYTNSELKNELNAFSTIKINKRLSTMIMGHGSLLGKKWDKNNDGFLDQPLLNQVNVFNRWAYDADNFHSITGINFVNENRDGGQMNFDKDIHRNDTNVYGLGIKNQRFQMFTKNGFLLKDKKNSSIGTQVSATYHKQDAFFGLTNYNGIQKSLYFNAIFQSQLTEKHLYSFGFSYSYDKYDETYSKLKGNKLFDTIYNQQREESVPGIFAQYTFEIKDKLTIIAGLRTDFNSYYKTFTTPRLHIKWNILDNLVLRASVGKGYRSANIFSENMGYMASSRKFMIVDKLGLEEAWNYGLNLSKNWELSNDRKASFTIDYYRTNFINQVVVDLDHSMHHVAFYNLGFNKSGSKSYSNSFQAEFNIEPIKRFNITIAGRYNDVKVDYVYGTMEKPYVSKYKGLLNLSYATKHNKWMFDFTIQYNGKSRLPNMTMPPAIPVFDNYSPAYTFLLGQITRKFKHFDVYIGSENIGDYMQHDPIMGSKKPFSNQFDASMIWGPIMGRMVYGGFRWSMN